jgi:hypothetical protein
MTKLYNMKPIKFILFAVVITFTAQACQSKKIASNQIEITGAIQKQGITTYQYGTHIITSDDKLFALKSSTIDLNKYLKQNVTIIGDRIAGYPIENGPDYIEVTSVK